jgi:hypothetical protein
MHSSLLITVLSYLQFQNRRRRSRKAGVELKRAGPDELPHNLFTESPETCPPHPLPTPLVKRPQISSPEVAVDEELPQACPSSSGTCALRSEERFRTTPESTDFKIPPYPDYNHTASSSCWLRPTKTQFSEPIWDRKPISHRSDRRVRSNAISVDDLSSIMAAKLRLFCGHSSPPPASVIPWHTMLYTYPSPSPLPALVRREVAEYSYLTTTAYIPPTNRLSRKRKRSETHEDSPASHSKHFRSPSTSSYSSFTGEDYRSSDNSSCDSSSPGPQTPPSALLPLPLPPRFVDWSKFSIPTIPQVYGLY